MLTRRKCCCWTITASLRTAVDGPCPHGRVTLWDGGGAVMADGARTIGDAGFDLDYFEARHAETLAPIRSTKDGPVRLLVAAKIGTTRLIDNIGV